MKILYLKSFDPDLKNKNDYLHDTLLIGLRELYGYDVIDYPENEYLYKDKNLLYKNELWGKGFTLYDILSNSNKIDRTDIQKKIKKNYFNIIIYGSIRGQKFFFEDSLNCNSKIAFIDTSDDPYIYKDKISKGIYFKRELYNKENNVLPISFAIPKSKISKEIKSFPKNLLSPLIPGKKKSYIYNNEAEYFKMYNDSLFSLTYRKTGWDCLRHYEILASGSIPLFWDIKKCPELTCTTLPKKQLIQILDKFSWVVNLYNPFKVLKKRFRRKENFINFFLNIFKTIDVQKLIYNNSEINDLRNNLLNYTKKNLTSEKLAKYVISKLSKL